MIFLRPWALLLLIVPFLMKGIQHFTKTQSPWNKFIDKKLLPSLLVKSKEEKSKKLWNGQMFLLWLLWTVALAGPAFNKLPTPAVESAPNSVIVFDLSMQGKELLQGQAKLYDLLSALNGNRVGLVVFGQNQGYTAMPLTPDISLIKEIVPTLTTDVLPEPALNPKAGFDYASQLLDNAGQKGRILYVSDKPVKWDGKYPFGVLDLNKRTADISDIKTLLEQTKKSDFNAASDTFSTTADVWADLGGWLVLISLPFFAGMFRKSVLFLIIFLIGVQAEAGFFQRPDQEVYQIEKKAVDAYQQKDFSTATGLFQQTGNLYNLGNALAFSGDIQGAINAYTEELQKNPNNQDAQFNKEYLEKQLPPPEEQQKQNKDGESENNKDNSDKNSEQDQQDKNQQNEQSDQENKNSGENQQKQSDNKEEKQSNQQPTQDETQAELEQALADYEKENSYNQEEQQIINRLNHDPSRVLRYRLMLQHQKGIMK
ncbi:MAG: hypothetical protein IKQ99_02385 [Alphaproteobacteria bacterium]|nr:hypothetical protein [Alphaproteobacteria bacterium]